jgi:hypothetical protein
MLENDNKSINRLRGISNDHSQFVVECSFSRIPMKISGHIETERTFSAEILKNLAESAVIPQKISAKTQPWL